MKYQELTKQLKDVQEELIGAGFIELIAPYFFINVNPKLDGTAKFQQLDQFAYLITVNEQVLRVAPKELIRNILIQQMLHACQKANGESIRWKLLIKEVNQAFTLDIPEQEYKLSELLKQHNEVHKNVDYADGYIIAQACTACGYKNVIPNIGVFVMERINCPMCEQDTCIQGA